MSLSPDDGSPPPLSIVYDREGEIWLRRRTWYGHTSWRKYYLVLCRLRRCLYLFDAYWNYERHLLELNGFENEFMNWTERISLQATTLYCTSTYFKRAHTFELNTPNGIYYLSCESEVQLRGWLSSLSLADVVLKSDEKPLLIWRDISPQTGEASSSCFYYCRSYTSLPDHERPSIRGWDAGHGIAKLVNKLSQKSRKNKRLINNEPSPSPLHQHDLSTPRNNGLLLGTSFHTRSALSEFTSDISFGKHGPLGLLSRSIFAALYSDDLSSTDPSSPFYDASATERKPTKYSRWKQWFYRTSENAAGKSVLLQYTSREDTKHHKSTALVLTNALVFDLALLHRQATMKVHHEIEVEERERWRIMKERNDEENEADEQQLQNAGATSSPSPPLSSTNDLASSTNPPPKPKVSKKSRRALKEAIASRIQKAYLSHPSLPESLPDFAPSQEEDFAVFISQDGSKPPAYIFFRAPTGREKVKWINVLRNLSGIPDGKMRKEDGEDGKGKKMMNIGGKEEKKVSLHNNPHPHSTTNSTVTASDHLTSDSISSSYYTAEDLSIHICRRDFYAILGCSPQASTDELTVKHDILTRELRLKLPKEKQDDVIIPQMNFGKQLELTPQMNPQLSLPATSPSLSDIAASESGNDLPASHPHHHAGRKSSAFSFDANAVAASSFSASSSASPHHPHNHALGELHQPSSSPPPLTPSQIELRLHRQIHDLLEIWRILRDPVRRIQYDEKRLILRLDELNGAEDEREEERKNQREQEEEKKRSQSEEDDEETDRRLTAGTRELTFRSATASAIQSGSNSTVTSPHGTIKRLGTLPLFPRTASTLVKKDVDLDSLLARASASSNALPRVTTMSPIASMSAQEEQSQQQPQQSPQQEERKYTEVEEKNSWKTQRTTTSSATNGTTATKANGGTNGTSGSPVAATNGSSLTLPSNTLTQSQSFIAPPKPSSSSSSSLLLPSPTQIGPLGIINPSMHQKYQIGELMTIEWNPRRDASMSLAAASSSPQHKLDPLYRVRLELMKRRPLVKDPVIHVITRETENSGVFQWIIPPVIQPNNDYYVRLTLARADSIATLNIDAPVSSSSSASSSTVQPQISRGGVFTITPVEKSETYTEGLENSTTTSKLVASPSTSTMK